MEHDDTLEGLLARIDALGLPHGAWVATDADGTLWAADVADDAWHRLLANRGMRAGAAAAMAEVLSSAGWIPTGEVHTDARMIYDLFRRGELPDGPLVEAMTFCFAGWSEPEVRAFAAKLYHDLLAPRVYATTRRLLEALCDRGFRVAVVSGSPRLLVEEALRGIGIDPLPLVLGTEVRIREGVLGTELVRPLTWREGKVRALQAHLGRGSLAVAFGDTSGDWELLQAASALRVLVHPRPGLRRRVDRDGGGAAPWSVFGPACLASGETVDPPSEDGLFG
ncbi:MAG: hypothetical protein D6731_07995 [Planctomycetota bacterium]|nr:MAG: hypothetical protein D6731_07995 [Planctomycetota bacterium]